MTTKNYLITLLGEGVMNHICVLVVVTVLDGWDDETNFATFAVTQ